MKYFIKLSLFLFLFTEALLAHPTLMMDYHIFFKFKKNKVTDIGETWIFDKLTSNELIARYKLEKKKTLNNKESREIGKQIVEGLDSVRYFTYISLNGKDLGKIKPIGYKAQINKGIFTFAFNNHLKKPIDTTKNKLSVEIKDPDSSITINLAKINPVILLGIDKNLCKINIKNKKRRGMLLSYDAYGMGMLLPDKEISLKCKK